MKRLEYKVIHEGVDFTKEAEREITNLNNSNE